MFSTATAALALLCWAACSAGAAGAGAQDSFGLFQTELGVGLAPLQHRSGRSLKRAKRKGGPLASSAASNDSQQNETSTADDRQANASVVNTSTANASAGAASAASSNSSKPELGSQEKETGWCGYEAQRGFITAYTKPGSDNLLLDFSEVLPNRSSAVRFLVTAMTVSGTYADGSGYITEYASPMEETVDTMFELRLNPDNISLDVFRPELDVRTSDKQMVAALQRGTGNGRFQNLGTYRCQRAPPQAGGFFSMEAPPLMVKVNDSVIPDCRLTVAPLLPHDEVNLTNSTNATNSRNSTNSTNSTHEDLLAENRLKEILSKLEEDRQASATRSKADKAEKSEPRSLIISGGALIRAGFFVAPSLKAATSYRLLGVKVFERNVDVTVEYQLEGRPVSVGFSLVRLPEAPMRPRLADDRLLYFTTDYQDLGEHGQYRDELPEQSVDRKVSTIWRYNLATLPGHQIRIHIDPTVPKRWRKWFRRGVEAWNEAFSLIGKPKAVRAVLPEDPDWPQDYDVSDARFSTISWTITQDVVSMGIAKVDPRSGEILKSDIIMSDGWVQAWLGDLDLLAPNFTNQLQETKGFRFEARSDPVALNLRRIPGRLRLREDWGKKISLLALASGKPLEKRERNEVLGQGLQNVVTHETGHILGLRHNFKGSLGVTYACIRSASCSEKQGLTASVMDYVPVNLPTADEPDVHLFSPVLGGYDKLAIEYGYMDVNASKGNASTLSRSFLEPQLRAVLRRAEQYETCYDADRIAGQDPSCMAYDISSDPLQAYEDELKRLVAVQANLLNTSVMPGAPYSHYGDAVDSVLVLARGIGLKLVGWLGGVQNSYVNRRLAGGDPDKVARRPLHKDVQKRALGLLLQVLRPARAGLLPPTEALPYLVAGRPGEGSVESLDLGLRVRSIARSLMAKALDPSQMLRLYAQERLEVDQGNNILTCSEFLNMFVKGVLGDGLATDSPTEWDLHRLLLRGLKDLHETEALPGEVRAQAVHHMLKLRSQTEAALTQLELEAADGEGEDAQRGPLLQAHLASLQQELNVAICGKSSGGLCLGLETGGAPPRRLAFGLWVLAITLWALVVPAP